MTAPAPSLDTLPLFAQAAGELATETDPGKRTRYQTRINELTARVNTVYDALGALPIDWSSPGGPP